MRQGTVGERHHLVDSRRSDSLDRGLRVLVRCGRRDRRRAVRGPPANALDRDAQGESAEDRRHDGARHAWQIVSVGQQTLRRHTASLHIRLGFSKGFLIWVKKIVEDIDFVLNFLFFKVVLNDWRSNLALIRKRFFSTNNCLVNTKYPVEIIICVCLIVFSLVVPLCDGKGGSAACNGHG